MASPSLHKTHLRVPWYNSQEWRNVYNQLFGEDSTKETMEEALNTLTIWKTRMPRLYAGIEGTLIVLKAVLEEKDKLPDDVYRQTLASSVMRFLNVCLSSSTKSQETFYHIAKVRKLPDWIVNIRHDFTHSQKIPSIEMLNRALHYSLNWLKVNYWDPQSENIKNYAPPTTNENKDIVTLISLYEKVALAEKNHSAVTSKLTNTFKKFKIYFDKSKCVMLQRIVGALQNAISTSSYDILNIPVLIVKNGAIFNFTGITEDNCINEDVLSSWFPMLLLLDSHNLLVEFLKRLIEICCKNELEKSKKSAAWIKTICKLGNKSKLFSNEDKTLLRDFIYWTITKKNVYATVYIKEMLILADFNDNFNMFTCRAVEALVPKPGSKFPIQIRTIYNLKDILDKDTYDDLVNGIKPKGVGWQIVNDSSVFHGIPIGKK